MVGDYVSPLRRMFANRSLKDADMILNVLCDSVNVVWSLKWYSMTLCRLKSAREANVNVAYLGCWSIKSNVWEARGLILRNARETRGLLWLGYSFWNCTRVLLRVIRSKVTFLLGGSGKGESWNDVFLECASLLLILHGMIYSFFFAIARHLKDIISLSYTVLLRSKVVEFETT